MANYPDVILTPGAYKDKGIAVSETKTVGADYKIQLANYAKRREVTTDGRIVASSIAVSYNGETYTEVFSTPVPQGAYFYSYDDATAQSTILLFNAAHSQALNLTVAYITRGDIITAARAITVETDIAAIETVLGVQTAVFQYGTVTGAGIEAVSIDTTRVSLADIDAITVLLSAAEGTTGHVFTIESDFSAVNILCSDSTINYLFIIHKS